MAVNIKLSALASSVVLFLLCSSGGLARADGMPFGNTKPEPILIPLDDALKGVHNKEQPVDVKQPPVQETRAPEVLSVVPSSRTVDVQPNASFFGLSVGMYDPFTHGKTATSLNLEWQPGVRIAGFLQPLFGAMVTTRGSLLGYGGIGVPLKISDRIRLMPSVSVGAYKKGGGFDLAQALAFRLGTELSYRFDDKSRVSLNLHILTNGASMERRDRTEVIGVAYTMPINMNFTRIEHQPATPAIEPVVNSITFQ